MAATPNVMADVKDWLLNKCRDASSLLAADRLPLHGGRQLTYSNVVVTPDNIPEFTIPSSMDAAIGGSASQSGLDSDLQSQSSSGGSVSSASGSRGSSLYPGHALYQQQSMTHRLVPKAATRSRSAPVSPMRSLPTDPNTDELLTPSESRFDDVSSETEGSLVGHTNSDPMSLAALSLPHLKMRTLYGFETLTESPHTRRKESLFHDGNLSDGAPHGLSLMGRSSKRKTPSSLETLAPQIITEDVDRATSAGRRHKRRHNVPAMIAPLGIVLSPNARVTSPHGSSSCRGQSMGNIGEAGCSPTHGPRSTAHFCSCPEINTYSTVPKHSQKHRTSSCDRQKIQPNLRRASLREENLLPSSLLSPEVSPRLLRRRNSGSHLMPSPKADKENWHILKAPSSASSSGDSSPCSSCQSCSRYSVVASSSGRTQQLGQVRLSLLYLPKQRQLKVGLIRAENLTSSASGAWALPFNSGLSSKHSTTDSSTTDQRQEQLNPYVKLCLMPGKVQRHVSKVVRQQRNPVFGQDFVFNDLPRHEVPEMRLRLKMYHKTAKLGRDELLGELQVSLAELIPSQETRLLRELEPFTRRQELGHIHISVCFYASAEKLTVAVHQVTDLNRHTFTGAPDPYVRVGLSQPRRSTTSHQTKTKKKNTAPVFNESFTFPISPKIEDLHYTSLTVTVLDHTTLRTDGQIGEVRLGFGATEEAEFHHWNQVLQQPGRVATNWHLLMDPISD